MQDLDRSWLAGLLEGEGSFTTSGSTVTVELLMTDLDVVNRAAELMGTSVHVPKLQPNRKQTYRARLYGARAKTLARELYPLMGIRRQARITELLGDVT